jgi:transcription elongation factor Elf1
MDFDDDEMGAPADPRRREFECPDCNAHNPADDGFVVGDEVICFYCGSGFRVLQTVGKVKLKAV